MVEAPVSIVSSQSKAVDTTKKDVRAIVVVCKCCSPSSQGIRERMAFLSRLNLDSDHTLIFPVKGGPVAVMADDVANSLKLLAGEYPSVSKVVMLANTKCACEAGMQSAPSHGPKSINQQTSDLLASHVKLTNVLQEVNNRRDSGHRIGIEMHHDTGGPVPHKIHFA